MVLRKSTKVLQSNKGFTFVEVIVGMGIVAFGLVGAMLTVSSTNAYMTQIRQQSLVTHALQEEIEYLRTQPFDSIVAGNFTASVANELNVNNNYAGTITISDPKGDLTKIKQVTVNIQWTGQDGRVFNRSLSTFMTLDGLNKQ